MREGTGDTELAGRASQHLKDDGHHAHCMAGETEAQRERWIVLLSRIRLTSSSSKLGKGRNGPLHDLGGPEPAGLGGSGDLPVTKRLGSEVQDHPSGHMVCGGPHHCGDPHRVPGLRKPLSLVRGRVTECQGPLLVRGRQPPKCGLSGHEPLWASRPSPSSLCCSQRMVSSCRDDRACRGHPHLQAVPTQCP